jgi:hypothetical protein
MDYAFDKDIQFGILSPSLEKPVTDFGDLYEVVNKENGEFDFRRELNSCLALHLSE